MNAFSPSVLITLFSLLALFLVLLLWTAGRQTHSEKKVSPTPPPASPEYPAKTPPSLAVAETASPVGLLDPAQQTAGVRTGGMPISPFLLKGLRTLILAATLLAVSLYLLILLPESWILGLYRQPAAVAETAQPLWLESMGEQKNPGEIRIFGLVRNASSREFSQVQALVKIYGTSGALLTTVATPIVVGQLSPQGISEFSVLYKIEDPGQISLYSVSFSLPDGTPLPHSDLRHRTPAP